MSVLLTVFLVMVYLGSLSMGAYGIYVWPCLLITLCALALMFLLPWMGLKKMQKSVRDLKGQLERNSKD